MTVRRLAHLSDIHFGREHVDAVPGAQAWIAEPRPDLTVVTFRGNVATRIAKLAAGEADVTLLAAAGLAPLDPWTDLGGVERVVAAKH